jgi:hypothetical protein
VKKKIIEGMLTKIGNIFSQSSRSSAKDSDQSSPQSRPMTGSMRNTGRMIKFLNLIGANHPDSDELRELLWSGCPSEAYSVRLTSWQILLGYIPLRPDRRDEILTKKRHEYKDLSKEYDLLHPSQLSESDRRTIHQVLIDIPRTCTGGAIDLKSCDHVMEVLQRVLTIWSIRNPACGYVQGMNDIAIPLLIVLLEAYYSTSIEQIDLIGIAPTNMSDIECDLYWMFSRLLQDLQDHYTFSQPGIQRMNKRLKEVIQRMDRELYSHFEEEQIDILQLSFRWYNCLLTREFDYRCVIRIWDTLIAEREGFSVFIVYFCSVLLLKHSAELKDMDMQQIMTLFNGGFNQYRKYNSDNIDTLLSEAYIMKSLFHSAPKHLNPDSYPPNPSP